MRGILGPTKINENYRRQTNAETSETLQEKVFVSGVE